MRKLAFILPFLAIAILCGFFSTYFLRFLFSFTDYRESNVYMIYLLPFFGLCFQFVSNKLPKDFDVSLKGFTNQSREKHKHIVLLAPYIFIMSLGTHLFGGSAGREGVGVLMGASFSEYFKKLKLFKNDHKKFLIYSGIAAGFSSIFGTPLAATMFAFEVQKNRDIKNKLLIVTTLGVSYLSYYITTLLNLEHNHHLVTYSFNSDTILYIVIIGLSCGIGARAFYELSHVFSKVVQSFFPNNYLRIFIVCSFISFFILYFQLFDYTGIGVKFINDSFTRPRDIFDFAIKLALTVLTLGIGFKGGEVTPLFFMGSSLANGLTTMAGFKNYSLSSGLGMFTFFAAATATPFASSLMAFEYFTPEVAVLCFATSLISRALMSGKSIYH